MNKVYVLGGAQTDFERNWTKEGKNVLALLKEVIDDGFMATGFDYDKVINLKEKNKIACFIGNFIAENYINQGHLGALITEVDPAFYGVPSARYEAACASSSAALDAAITKIQAGIIDVALVIGFELMKTVDAKTGGDFLGKAAYYEKEGKGIDFPFPALFGRLAEELITKYDFNETRFMDSLALIAAKNYENAKHNPYAQTRKWFMGIEQAKNRGRASNMFIGGKLAVSDCSQVTDGAVLVILASEAYCRQHTVSDKPMVKGYGHRVAPMLFSKKMADSKDSEYILPWTRRTVLDAYKMAGLSINDIDFFEAHDCFTSSEFIAVSAFGITPPGKEIEAIEDGITRIDGKKPINISGGLIGCGHPVGASGARMFLDLYKQIARKADNGMMLNIGGSATTNYVFIMGRE